MVLIIDNDNETNKGGELTKPINNQCQFPGTSCPGLIIQLYIGFIKQNIVPTAIAMDNHLYFCLSIMGETKFTKIAKAKNSTIINKTIKSGNI